MADTVDVIQDDPTVNLFYYLKITGIPYYFGAAINPTSTAYGSAAWTLPTGYTWVSGMDLPDDRLEQEIRDIVGGIASAEQLRVRLIDFETSTSAGQVRFLSRLFAPGRLANSGPVPELESRIRVTDTSGATFSIRNCQTSSFVSESTVHVGSEAIGISNITAPSSGRSTITISARNKFPCATGFPPVPFHRVYLTDGDTLDTGNAVTGTGVPGRNQLVTGEPHTLIGRTCALYVAHMTHAGTPCTEAESWCRLLGRVTSMNISREGGTYELQIQSITGELEDSTVAPGLATATIAPGFINLSPVEWRRFAFTHRVVDTDDNLLTEHSYDFEIDDGSDNIYESPEEIVIAVNNVLRDGIFLESSHHTFTPVLKIVDIEGERRFAFDGTAVFGEQQGHLHDFGIRNWGTSGDPGDPRGISPAEMGLCTVLGYIQSELHQSRADPIGTGVVGSGAIQAIVADLPVPSCFVPYGYPTGTTVRLAPPDYSADEFFDDQGHGVAYARFGDGSIVRVNEVQGATHLNRLIVGIIPGQSFKIFTSAVLPGNPVAGIRGVTYYRVNEGKPGTISQVVIMPADVPEDQGITASQFVGRLLASNPAGSVDADYNTFPEGVGLGWIDILDTATLRKLSQADVKREVLIDQTTKFSDIFTAMAREYGWILVWDPEQSKVSIRRIMVPAGPVAHTLDLTESNRCREDDRTSQKVDQSNIRTSWTLKWGWDRSEQKFLAPDFTWVDRWTLSAFGGLGRKADKIEDKTLVYGDGNSGAIIIGEILQRSYFYRQPWLLCKRSLTKSGLVLAPGSVHQIVDNTLINPFTGALGVTASDRVYGLLMGVSANPATGECEVSFTVNRQDPAGLYRAFSPCALVDFSATNNGYSTGTGVITLDSYFASDGASDDGIDFLVGDKVILVSYDNGDSVGYYRESTVTAVAANGSTMTVSAGLPAVSSTTETIVVLQEYADQTAARLQGDSEVAFQGAESGVIGATANQNHRWI